MSSVHAESPETDVVAIQSGAAAAPVSRRTGRLWRLVLPAATLVAVVAAWQSGLFHSAFGLEPYTLAYPSDILDTVRTDDGTLLRGTLTTLSAALAGFSLGSVTGFLLAILLAEFAVLRRTLLPMLSGLVSMPIIALAPLMVLYFGLGVSSKIAVATIMCMAPMAVTAYKGLNCYDSDSADLLHSYAASRPRFWLVLKLPVSLPFVFTALKLNVNLSLIGVIIAEFFGGNRGLGREMKYAIETFNMPVAWTTIVIAALLGIVLYQLVSIIERVLVPWDRSFREGSTD
jgi:NitT/TauT family transport system permease protein